MMRRTVITACALAAMICSCEYISFDYTGKGEEVTEIEDGGLRLRGNTSRRRPEGNGGEVKTNTIMKMKH